ncbi:TPA: glycine cleavage system protein H [Candidatus Poribacteria bacterium]|nr:glycine cleavage system protein H [Candidatus Poribacteria bacterium]
MDRVKYTRTHEWIEIEILQGTNPSERKQIGTVGITERVQEECGQIAYVELPDVGDEYEQEEPLCSLELANSDVHTVNAPVTGEVLEVNQALKESPDLINQAPEGDGWLFKISIDIPRELSLLMHPDEYERFDEDDYEDDDEEGEYEFDEY